VKVLLTGTFDILHKGHIDLINWASKKGELIILIDSDSRVKSRKGQDRPINNFEHRKATIESLYKAINNLSFAPIFKLEKDIDISILIDDLGIDAIAVGEEYRGKVIGGDKVSKIFYFPRKRGYSSTDIIERIKK
jgi:cytidyltransferase-like protein